MQIKQNPLIKIGAGVVICFVLISLNKKSSESDAGKAPPPAPAAASPVVQQTSSEELAAVNGYLSAVEQKQSKLENMLGEFATKNDVIAAASSNAGTGISVSMEQVRAVVQEQLVGLQQQLSSEKTLAPNNVGDVNEEITNSPFSNSFEINPSRSKPSGTNVNVTVSDGIQWEYPVGYTVNKDGEGSWYSGMTAPLSLAAGSTVNAAMGGKQALEDELKPIPFYTIHTDASLHGATAYTALIGRVERNGTTHDPFRFQIVLSKETLLANGLDLPDIADAVVSGVAVGDSAFRCVRGKVTSFSFNFTDGRIFNKKGTYEAPLATLGDAWGNPCVKGVMVDDIGKIIAMQSGVAGLASYAETIAKQQQSLVSNGAATGLALSGSAGKLAAGSMASGGLSKTAEIVSERYESYYEAIYVAPGQKVTLFVEQPIEIDYNPSNRMVNYAAQFSNTGSLD